MADIERIYGIHSLLKTSRQPVTKKGLGTRFEVCEKTIQRDLDFMKDRLRAPLIYDYRRRSYGYAPDQQDFELPGLWFNAEELRALLTILQLIDQLQGGTLRDHMQPLRDRLERLLDKSGHAGQQLGERILIKTHASRTTNHNSFDLIAHALLDERALIIDYHSRSKNEQQQRTIHPQRLVHYRENWYLVAWCDTANALRTFSLDRIRHTQTSTAPFRLMDQARLEEYLHGGFGIFGGKPTASALLRFSAKAARWVADEIWHPDQKGEWQGEHYLLRIAYADPTELLLQVQRYGPEVEVLEPTELRRELAKQLREAAALYREEP